MEFDAHFKHFFFEPFLFQNNPVRKKYELVDYSGASRIKRHSRQCLIELCVMLKRFHVYTFQYACAPLSMGFSSEEHWSGLPLPPPGPALNPGLERASLASSALAAGFLTAARQGSPRCQAWQPLPGFPGGAGGNAPACRAGDLGSVPGQEDPWRRKWQSTPVLLPGKIPWTEQPGRLQSVGSQ